MASGRPPPPRKRETSMGQLRRLCATVAMAAAATAATFTWAQGTWAPSKPVRIIVPIVGSTNDVLARLLAPRLQQADRKSVV